MKKIASAVLGLVGLIALAGGAQASDLTVTGNLIVEGGSPWADVVYFGAYHDSDPSHQSANDTAFASARTVADAINGAIFVPSSGDYYCLDNFVMDHQGTSLIGESWQGANLAACGNNVTVLYLEASDVTVRDIQVTGKGAAGDPGEMTFGASYPAVEVTSGLADDLLQRVYVLGGSNAIANYGNETYLDLVSTDDAYGSAAFYSNGGGWYRRTKFDHPAWACSPVLGYTINTWSNLGSDGYGNYSTCDIVYTSGWYIQAVSGGTAGTNPPDFDDQSFNYGQVFHDCSHSSPCGTAQWIILGPYQQAAVQLDPSAHENYFQQADMTGAYTYGLYINGAANTKCEECVISQAITEAVYIANNAYYTYLTDDTIGCSIQVSCAAIFLNGGTYTTVTGGILQGYYGLVTGTNQGGIIVNGVNLQGKWDGVYINTGDGSYNIQANVCANYGGIADLGTGNKLVQGPSGSPYCP